MNAKWLGKHIPAKKIIGLAVLFVFFAGFVMDAPAVVDVGAGPFGAKEAERPGYAQVNIGTFTIPGHLGEIKYSAKNNPKKIVIHIQDAHCNRYAQRKIADLIAYINAEYGVRTINLEGGVGDYDLAIFTSITGEAIRTEVADYFLKKGELNGAEFFAVNNPERAFLWGVEDKDLYLANLQVYRDSLRYKEEVDKYLDELSHIMNKLKMHIYTQELITVDMNYNSFKTKKMEFREYFEFLLDGADAHNVDIKKFKNLNLLKDAVEKEEAIDFDRANDERDILIGELKERISRADLRKIVSMTVDFKTKKITQKAFYGHLLDKARRARIDTGTFPMMTSYLDYVSTFEEVDRFKIMGELDELEAAIKEDVYQNDTQRDLNKLSRNSVITKNIFDISLNKTDYNYYLKNKDSFAVRNYLTFIEKEAPKYRVTARPSRSIARMDDYREELSEFFKFSFMRDEVFLKNMKYERMPYGVEVAILMTGGFHTENLCDLFNKKNISYVSIHPKFTIAKGYKSPYFEILAGETIGVQQVLRSALAQASLMQVASFLSTAMAEAVYGQAGLDSFNASVMLRALVERGYAVTFSYTDADGTLYELDLNKAFNRPADPGAPEITLTPANIIKELHQKQADESVRAAKREAVSEDVRLEAVELLQNMRDEIYNRGHHFAAFQVEKLIDELKRQDSEGNYAVTINLLTEGEVPIFFEEHAGGMGLHVNRAAVERTDGSIDTAKLLELIVHGISAGFSGDHGVSSLLQQAARAIRARRPVDIDYNDLADVLTSGVMRPGSVWQAREHVISLLADRGMTPDKEGFENAYNEEMDNILEDRDLFSAAVMEAPVAEVRAPVERVAPEAARAEEGPKRVKGFRPEDFVGARERTDRIAFFKKGAFLGWARFEGIMKMANGETVVVLEGDRCINLDTGRYTRVMKDDGNNIIGVEAGGVPIGDFELTIERPGAEDILREFEGLDDALAIEAVLRSSELARLYVSMALTSIADGDLDTAGELIEAARKAAEDSTGAYDMYFGGKDTDAQRRAAEIRDEATGAVSEADSTLSRALERQRLAAEAAPEEAPPVQVDGSRLNALLTGEEVVPAKPWNEMSNDEIFDMFKDMLNPPSRNTLNQLRRDGRVRLGRRAQEIASMGYDLANGKGVYLLLESPKTLDDKVRMKKNFDKAGTVAKAWLALKVDPETLSQDFKNISLEALKSFVAVMVAHGLDIYGENKGLFIRRIRTLNRGINKIDELNMSLPDGFKIPFNKETVTSSTKTLEDEQKKRFAEADEALGPVEADLQVELRAIKTPEELMTRLGITGEEQRREIIASLPDARPEQMARQLLKRVNMARGMGYDVPNGFGASLLAHTTHAGRGLGLRAGRHDMLRKRGGTKDGRGRALGALRSLLSGTSTDPNTLTRDLDALRGRLEAKGFTMDRLSGMSPSQIRDYVNRCIRFGLDIYDNKNKDFLSDQVMEAVQRSDNPEAVKQLLEFNSRLIRLLNNDILKPVGAKTIDIDTGNQVALLFANRDDIIRQALRNILARVGISGREFDTFGLPLIEGVLGLATGQAVSVRAVIDLANKGLPELFARIRLIKELNVRLSDLSDRYSEALEGKSLVLKITAANLVKGQDQLRNLARSRENSLVEALGNAKSVEQLMTWLGITDRGLRGRIKGTSEDSVKILARRISDTRKMGYDVLNGKGAELLEFGFSGENRLGRRVAKRDMLRERGRRKDNRGRAMGALRALLGGTSTNPNTLTKDLNALRGRLGEKGLTMARLSAMSPEQIQDHVNRCIELDLDIYGNEDLLSDQAVNAVGMFDTNREVLDYLAGALQRKKDFIQLLNNVAPVPFFAVDPTAENFQKTETELIRQAMTGMLVESGSSEGNAKRVVDELYPRIEEQNIQSQINAFADLASRAQHINDLNNIIGEMGEKIALSAETLRQTEGELDRAAKENILKGQGAMRDAGVAAVLRESVVDNAEVTPQELARRIDLLTKFAGLEDLRVPENAEQLKKTSDEIRENVPDASLIAQVFRVDVEEWLGKDVDELTELVAALGAEEQPRSKTRLIEMLIERKYGFKTGETIIVFRDTSGRSFTGVYYGIGMTKGKLGVRINYPDRGVTDELPLRDVVLVEEVQAGVGDIAQRPATRIAREAGFVGRGNVREAARTAVMEVDDALRQRLTSDLSEGDWVELAYTDGTVETAKVQKPTLSTPEGAIRVWSARGESDISVNDILGFRRITRMGSRDLRSETSAVMQERLNLAEMQDRVRLRVAGQEEPAEGLFSDIDRDTGEVIIMVTVREGDAVTIEERRYPFDQLQAIEKTPDRAEDELTPSQMAEAHYRDLSFAARQYAGMENSEMRNELSRYGIITISDSRNELANMLAAVEFGLTPGQIVMIDNAPHYYFGIRIQGDRASLSVRRITGEASEAPYRSIEIPPTTVDDFLTLDITPNDLVSFTVLDENGEPAEDLGNVIYQGITGDTVSVIDAIGVREFSVSRIQAGSLEVNRNRWTPSTLDVSDYGEMKIDGMPMDMLHEITENPSLAEVITTAFRYSKPDSGRNQTAYVLWGNIEKMFPKLPGQWKSYIDAKIRAASEAAAREEAAAEAAAKRVAHKRPGAVGAQAYDMDELAWRGYKSHNIDNRDVSAAASLSGKLLPNALGVLRAARVKSRAEIESILNAMKSEGIALISSGVTTLDEAIRELEGKLEVMKEKPELKSVEVRVTAALADEDRAISEFDAKTGVLKIYLNRKGAEEFLADSKALAHLIREEFLEATPQGWDLSHRQIKHLEMIENGFNALTVLNVKELEMMEDAELGKIKSGHVSDPGGFFFRASQELMEMELTVAYKDNMHPVKDPTALVMGMPADQWADSAGELTIDRKYQETVDNIAANRFKKKMGISVRVFRYKLGDEGLLNKALEGARKWDAFTVAAADPAGKPRIVILTDKTLEARAREEGAKDDVAGMILHNELAKGQFLRTDMFMQLGTVFAEIQRNPEEADPVLLKLAKDRLNFITGGNYTDPEGRQLRDLTWDDMLELLRGQIIITIQKIDYGEITEWKRARMAVLRSL